MPSTSFSDLCEVKRHFEFWGEVAYEEAVTRQLELVEKRARGEIPDTWVFCHHPPVVTLGRASNAEDILDWKGDVVSSSRGGRATYHGPSQLVIYPITQLVEHDIIKFLIFLEALIIKSLKPFDILASMSREAEVPENGKRLIPTGVWVDKQKIASIGIAVKKWVSYHGIAINLYEDHQAFKGIQACGFDSQVMTSIERVTGVKINRKEYIQAFVDLLKDR